MLANKNTKGTDKEHERSDVTAPLSFNKYDYDEDSSDIEEDELALR